MTLQGWPLAILGSSVCHAILNQNGSKIMQYQRHSMFPWMFCLARTEPEIMFRRLYETAPLVLSTFFNVDVLIKPIKMTLMIDHSDAEA